MAAKSKKQKSAKQGKKQTKDKKGKQQKKQGKGKKDKRKQPIEIVDEVGSVPVGFAEPAPVVPGGDVDGGKGVGDSVRMKATVEQVPVDVAQSVEIKSRAFEYVPAPEDAAESSAKSSKYSDIEPIDVPVVSDEDVIALEEVIAHLETVPADDGMVSSLEPVAETASMSQLEGPVEAAAAGGQAASDSPAPAASLPDGATSEEVTDADADAGAAVVEEHAAPAEPVEAAESGDGPDGAEPVVPDTVASADGIAEKPRGTASEAVVEASSAEVPTQPDDVKRTAPGQTAELPKVPETGEAPEQKQGRGQALIATLCAVALVLFVIFLILVFTR